MNNWFLLFFLFKYSDSYLKYTIIIKKNHTNETKYNFSNIIKKINHKNILKSQFTDESMKHVALLF